MNPKDLAKIKKGKLDLRGADLRYVDLQEEDLRGADLREIGRAHV